MDDLGNLADDQQPLPQKSADGSPQFSNIFRKLATNRRARWAVGSNALISVTSLLLAVSIARRATIAEFGDFALAMSVFILASGLIRSAVTETTLAIAPTKENNQAGFQRSVLVSLGLSALLVFLGLLVSSSYFVVLGVSFSGLASLDYVRTVNAALYNSMASLYQGIVWSIFGISISILSLFVAIPPLAIFACWAISGSLVGYASSLIERYPQRPRWNHNTLATRAAAFFSLDYLAGSGGSILSTTLLGATAGSAVVGALRGAATVLGPLGILSTTARSLTIPYLSRARSVSSSHEFRTAINTALVLLCTLGPIAAIICFLPEALGTQLLGPTWIPASILLPALAIESILALVSNIPAAGHRARLAGGRALTLRLSVGIPRPLVVIGSAALFGASGAAWSMAGIAALNTIVWWASYWNLTRKVHVESNLG